MSTAEYFLIVPGNEGCLVIECGTPVGVVFTIEAMLLKGKITDREKALSELQLIRGESLDLRSYLDSLPQSMRQAVAARASEAAERKP